MTDETTTVDTPTEAPDSTVTTTVESDEASIDAELNSHLDRLMGVESNENADASDTNDQAVDTDDGNGGGGKSGKEATPPPAAANPSPELVAARDALKKAGWPDDVLDGLPPERVQEIGGKAAKDAAEQARVIAEQERFKQVIAEYERNKQPATPADKPAEQISEVDEALKPFEEHDLKDLIGDVAGPLKNAFKAQEARHTKVVEALKAENDRAVDHVLAQMDRLDLAFARLQLQSEIPHLTDAEKFKAVTNRIYQLANLTGYRGEDGTLDTARVMRDAARMLYGDADVKNAKADAQKTLTQRYQAQMNGQSGNPTSQKTPGKALTQDEQMERALDMLSNGMTPDEVSRNLNTLRT